MRKENLIGFIFTLIASLAVIFGSCKIQKKDKPVINKITPDSVITEFCDSITKQWSMGSKKKSIKNINLKDSLRFDFMWDPKSYKWINYEKIEIVYDTKGFEKSQMYYSFDNKTDKWIYSSKSEATYDNKGYKLIDSSQRWEIDSNKWIAFVKTEFFYDKIGNDTLENWYFWNENSSLWKKSSKVENTYDKKGNKILRIDYKLIQGTVYWENLCKYEYAYDGDYNLTNQKYYFWNSLTGMWINNSISEFDYTNNLISHFYHRQWIYTLNSWLLDNRSTYYYKK